MTGTAALVFTALVALGVGVFLLSEEQARTLREQEKRALAQVDALLPGLIDGQAGEEIAAMAQK